jgi:hypothetical protein
MTADLPPITGVTGGVAGLTATYAAMLALADRFAAAAGGLRDRARADLGILVDPDLVESAPLSPMTFAEAEALVLDASSGIHGALEAGAVFEADALLVRATVTAYQECDGLVAGSLGVLDETLGQAAGYAVRSAAPALLPLGLAVVPAWRHLPARTRARLAGDVDEALEEWVDEHPETVQHALDGSGGFLDGVLGLPPTHPKVADAASGVAALYPPEGEPQVRRRDDLATPLADSPPGDLAGLLRRLEQTNALSTPDRPGDQGTIEVQTLRAHDGTVRHIVYLPGTDQIATTPWSPDAEARDLPADLHAMADEHSTYAAGIEQAMSRAGIGPHDPVLLVGHSLGGMEAASLLSHGSGFHVTHVVTAGSPVAEIRDYPAGSHVLSLENRADVVPLLDGHRNADSVQQVTVQFDDHAPTAVAGHRLRHYVRGAAAVDASCDPSVREQLASLHAHGFLGSSGHATSQVFQIVR